MRKWKPTCLGRPKADVLKELCSQTHLTKIEIGAANIIKNELFFSLCLSQNTIMSQNNGPQSLLNWSEPVPYFLWRLNTVGVERNGHLITMYPLSNHDQIRAYLCWCQILTHFYYCGASHSNSSWCSTSTWSFLPLCLNLCCCRRSHMDALKICTCQKHEIA